MLVSVFRHHHSMYQIKQRIHHDHFIVKSPRVHFIDLTSDSVFLSRFEDIFVAMISIQFQALLMRINWISMRFITASSCSEIIINAFVVELEHVNLGNDSEFIDKVLSSFYIS
eukprot:992480_1